MLSALLLLLGLLFQFIRASPHCHLLLPDCEEGSPEQSASHSLHFPPLSSSHGCPELSSENLDLLSSCLKDRKEQTALGRWLACVEMAGTHLMQDCSVADSDMDGKEVWGGGMLHTGQFVEKFTLEETPISNKSFESLSVSDGNVSLASVAELAVMDLTRQAGEDSLSEKHDSTVGEEPNSSTTLTLETIVEELRANDPLPPGEDGIKASVCTCRVDDEHCIQRSSLSTLLKLNVGALILTAIFLRKRLKQKPSKHSPLKGTCGNKLRTHRLTACGSRKEIARNEDEVKFETRWNNSLLETLGAPLGTAVAAVFAEVSRDTDCCLEPWGSSDELAMLLETALEKSLQPIFGNKCMQLVKNFKVSFSSTYGAIESLRQERHKRHAKFLDQGTKGPACVHEECCNMKQSGSTQVMASVHNSDTLEVLRTELPQKAYPAEMHEQDCTSSIYGQNPIEVGFEEDAILLTKSCFQCRSGKSESIVEVDRNSSVTFGGDCFSGLPHISTTKSQFQKNGFTSQQEIEGMQLTTKFKCDNACQIEKHRSSDCSMPEKLIIHQEELDDSCDASQDSSFIYSNIGTRRRLQHKDLVKMQKDNFSSSDDLKCSIKIPATSYCMNRAICGSDDDDSCGNDSNIIRVKDTGSQVSSPKMNGSEGLVMLDNRLASRQELKGEGSKVLSKSLQVPSGIQDAIILASSRYVTGPSVDRSWQESFLNIFEKSVQAQEHHNYIKSMELSQRLKHLSIGEEQLQLTHESNRLMKQSLVLNHSKAIFKENEAYERKMTTVHFALSRTCADELVAGLFVMLFSLIYGVRKYSVAILSHLVSTCQLPDKEPRRSSWLHIDWFYNSLDSLTSQLHAFICQVTIAGRMLVGLAIAAVVASALLRQSVTSSSQAMPATIIVIILGGVCGFAGKISIDSLGGNGIYWLLIWEALCSLHALAACFTPFVFSMLNEPHGILIHERLRLWVPPSFRKLVFHSTIVLILPVLAGQLPFAPFREVTKDLMLATFDGVISPILYLFRNWVRYTI